MPQTNRRTNFSWHSRQDLYDFFGGNYSLNEEAVDNAIMEAFSHFAIRSGAPINMEQLWQKAGELLVKKCTE